MLCGVQVPEWAFAVHPEEPPCWTQLGKRAPVACWWAGPFQEAVEDNLQRQSRELRRQLQPTDPTCSAQVKSNTLTFDLLLPVLAVADSSASPEGDNGTIPNCCPVASEVFITGTQQRLCASTWSYLRRNRAAHDKMCHFFCQIWGGTAGWSTLAASPWSPVPSATTRAPLSSVHHPSPAARTLTHRSNSNWY